MPEYTRGQITRELEAGPRHPRVIANAMGCSIADAGFQKTLRTLRNDGVIEYDKHSQMYSLVKPPLLNGKPIVGLQPGALCPECGIAGGLVIVPAHFDGDHLNQAVVSCACGWESDDADDVGRHWHDATHKEYVPVLTPPGIAQEAAGDAHDDPPAETVAEDAPEAPAYKGTRSAVVVDVLRKLIAEGGEFNTETITQHVLAAVGGAKDDLDAKRWTGAIYNTCHTAKRDGWLARSLNNKQGWWMGAQECAAMITASAILGAADNPMLDQHGKPIRLFPSLPVYAQQSESTDTPTDQVSDLMLRAMRVLVDRMAVKGIEAGENPDQWARALQRLGDYVIGIDVAGRRSSSNDE